MFSTLKRPALVIAASAALGACSMYDDGYGYGRGVVSVGYSSGGYYPYGSRYDRYPYYGWYDGFYYPGAGYYVYDRRGTRHRWSDGQRRYWEGRRGDRVAQENWGAWRGRQFSGRRGDGDWQGRDRHGRDRRWEAGDGRQNWRSQRDRQDRQGWQARGVGRQVTPDSTASIRQAPPPRSQESRGRADRAREFGRGKDKRRD